MEITLIRHGKTEYNEKGLLQGIKNEPLTDAGRIQVKKLKMKLNNERFDICFTSPLIRSFETAMILVGDKVEIKKDPRLIERDYGKLEGTDKNLLDRKLYFDYSVNTTKEEVESIKHLENRLIEFINYLEKNYKNKKILIVTHGAVIRILRNLLLNEDKANILAVDIPNCYIEKIQYKN